MSVDTNDCTCPAIGNPWFSHSPSCPIRTGIKPTQPLRLDETVPTTANDEQTFLIAVTVTGWPTRTRARRHVYDLMAANQRWGHPTIAGRITEWHDASVDSTDRSDSGEAVWTHPGRGIEAQHALVVAGLAPEADERIGHHPQVHVIRNGDEPDGDVLCFECDRCGNASDEPAVLGEVPCIDLSKWEHAHLWGSDEDDPIQRITCYSDCGMTIEFGQAVGAVSTEAAGSPPE